MGNLHGDITLSAPMISPTEASRWSPNRKSEEPSQWGVHWRTPFFMAVTFLLGITTAVGHHLFYTSLDGTKVEDKDKRISLQAGTALSYLAKALFAYCIGISHRQRIWYTLRRKPLSIRAINALFGALDNPLAIFERDMVFGAKISTIMAIISWLLAIAAILAPGTLTIQDKVFVSDRTVNVPHINITGWNSKDGNAFAKSLFSYEYHPDIDTFSFKGASPITERLTSLVAYSGNIIPVQSPCGSNCSYTVEFEAPTLSCQKQEVQGIRFVQRGYGEDTNLTVTSVDADGLLDPDPGLGNSSTSFCCVNYNATLKSVDENSTDGRSGLRNQMSLISGTYLPQGPPRKLEDIQSILCTPYTANYTVDITFTNGFPTFQIVNLTLLSLFNETIQSIADADIGIGSFNEVPARGLIDGLYQIFLGSIGYAQFRNPTIVVNGTSVTNTEIALATIPESRADALDWAPRVNFTGDLNKAVEELSHNLTISLFSISPYKTSVEARITESHLAYTYDKFALLITYLAAVTATLLCLLVGIQSLWSNGIASDSSFARVLVTTRNPTLDRLSENVCLGGDPFPKKLLKTKLKFGELWRKVDESGFDVTHAGFGTAEEVVALRKGEKYL